MTELADPPKSKKEMRREAMLDAAEALIIKGRGEFEIAQLASAAGVSNGLAYHYFGSKDGVFEAVIDRFYARYSTVMDRPADPEIAWGAREHARLLDTIAFLYADPFAPIAFGALGHAHAVEKEYSVQRNMIARAAHNVRSGQRRGQIPTDIDSELAGAAIIGAVRAVMMTAMRMDPRPAPEKVADQLWELIAGAVRLGDG